MEISGVVSRQIPFFSGAGIDTHSSKPSSCCVSFDYPNQLSSDSKIFLKSRNFAEISSSIFSDKGHLQYYVSPRSGTKKKEKEKNLEMGIIKKKLKLVKGLSKNLSMFSSMGFGLEMDNGLISEVKGKNLSEASEILMAQLKQLKADKKEIKRKKKEEKAKLKSIRVRTKIGCESSSSSSESSDSECGEVVNMNCLRNNTLTELKVDELRDENPESEQRKEEIEDVSSLNSRQVSSNTEITSSTSCCSSGTSTNTVQRSSSMAVMATSGERIEVCMGGKCKKSGAIELLEEFEKRVGIENGVTVVGCKCMGKCRDGPNVRVLNQCNNNNSGYVEEETTMVDEGNGVKSPVTNPLYVGVGLEDVGLIVSNFFGNQKRELGGLIAA